MGRRCLKIREGGVNYITDGTASELSRVQKLELVKLKFRSELFTYPARDET